MQIQKEGIFMGFEFRDTPVYQEALSFHLAMKRVIDEKKLHPRLADQLYRASLSIALNIAEGYGRFHKADKRSFYINSRASVNECVACLDVIFDSNIPEEYLNQAETLAKMLSGLINTFTE